MVATNFAVSHDVPVLGQYLYQPNLYIGISHYSSQNTVGYQEVQMFSKIFYRKNVYAISPALRVTVVYKNGYYQIDCPDISVFSAGETYVLAVESFSEDFDFSWSEYAEEDDSNLSGDARKLKQWFLKHVRKLK